MVVRRPQAGGRRGGGSGVSRVVHGARRRYGDTVRALIAIGLSIVLAGCLGGYAPVGPPAATDLGFLGCQVGPQPGAPVREGDPLAPGEPMFGSGIETMTPRAAGDAVRARGLHVTWRYMYWFGPTQDGTRQGFSECWCEPPPDGRITGVSYGLASEIVLMVDSGRELDQARPQPDRGWGC